MGLGKGKQVMLALSVATMFAGCGGRQEDGVLGDLRLESDSIIVGDLDWKDIGDLADGTEVKTRARAIVDLSLPALGSRCTGFLINEDTVLTNQHCIPAASYSRGVTARFLHQKGVDKAQQQVFDCSTFIGNDEALDFALLKCAGRPGDTYGAVELTDRQAVVGNAVHVIQQNCDYYTQSSCDWNKKVAHGKITEVADEYTHDADTLGGSSGSPVFASSDNKVIALHHAGYGNDGRGRGVENYAVPMSKIVPFLKSRFPSVKLGLVAQPPVTPGEKFGPNDTFDQAAALSASQFGQQLSEEISSATDKDYYKVTLSKRSRLVVSVAFWHRLGDLDLSLQDSAQKVLAKSQGTVDSEKTDLVLPAGTYIFQVYGYKGAKTKYNFRVSVLEASGV